MAANKSPDVDPTALLTQIREMARGILTGRNLAQDARMLAEGIQQLDASIVAGGNLPAPWVDEGTVVNALADAQHAVTLELMEKLREAQGVQE